MTQQVVHKAHQNRAQELELGTGPGPKVSLVMPVRDCEDDVIARVERTFNQIQQCVGDAFEMVVVDDGSEDRTLQRLDELLQRHSNLRLARHDRPRGLESAGQTGLERSIGEVVLIAENENPLRIEDIQRLVAMSTDRSIVAARAESTKPNSTSPLVRRLRANVSDADHRIDSPKSFSPVQMVRRQTMQYAVRNAASINLSCDSIESTTI